ncbi:helicase-related protein [Paucibacter sp. APW11]|uniref:Helicase-related protein n=1 Tax=Roseateles aquae TaxID=3077235 RepID=A0ABU3PAW2_9BURK|nr:helicase-related protein [Paucibacter sp. APW11]MDT8999732.1 helicase-related protein [Paucibacter sp. APW11]
MPHLDSPAVPAAATPAAAPLSLPQPRHLKRLPAGLTTEQWLRIRQAAYQLPQVLSPADLDGPDHGHDHEKQLDALGLILIQKAVSGARPSRWIAPRLIAVALEHLDAVGSAPTVRALMQKRSSQLDALGLAREGLDWSRLCSQTMHLSREGWQLPVAFRVPLDAQAEAAIWDFYRDGDLAALSRVLGPQPDYPHHDELLAHLDALLERSASGHEEHIASLLPRLQAECGVPQTLAQFKAATTRAQDRWEHAVAELNTLARLNSQLAFQGYPDTFEPARRLQRRVTLFVGAPNSGKTHAAFERLSASASGAYLAPLRLLALEGRDRLVGRGVPCSLLTGEENVPAEDARVVSSTIEMVNTSKVVEVAVIDEAQMLFDTYRGWAWTQAIVAVPAEELIIICSAYAVPAIENLLGLCGERCTVRHFERKQEVQLLPAPVPIAALKKGDAVVAFSRREVLMLRDQIASAGHPVSVIYGALPPEVRRREAERFANGASHILVATDAIGMGLNLPIRRVLFSTMTKFDGQADRTLSVSETHQIAGRAGRYGMHDEGFCGVLREAEPTAARTLKELLPKSPRAPRDFKAAVAPNWWHVDTIAQQLGLKRLHAVLGVFMDRLRLDDAHFAVAELEQMLELAEQLDHAAPTLTLKQRFIYAQAPVDSRTPAQVQEYLDWASRHALIGQVGAPWFLDDVDEHSRLDRMEQALRSCTLWLWLDLRFPGVYGHLDAVVDLRSRLNDGIERHLKGKKPLWQTRGGRGGGRAR